MKIFKKTNRGFTLIELMITIAISGVLAAIAVPQYQTYTKKAKFTEVIRATAPFKLAIEVCTAEYSINSDAALASICGSGSANGIPANVTESSGYVQAVSVQDGKITATAVGTSSVAVSGMNGETYILVPTLGAINSSGTLAWTKSTDSSCIAAAIC